MQSVNGRSVRRAAAVACGLALAAAAAAQIASPDPARSARNLESFDFAWQRIADSFWDEEMGGIDWQAVRDELRPQARDAGDDRALRGVLQEMISRLGQSHFGVLPGPDEATDDADSSVRAEESGEDDACSRELMRAVAGEGGSAASDAGPGFDFRFLGETAVVTRVEPDSAAQRQGVAPGLEVARVGGQSLAPLARCLELDSLAPWTAKMVRYRAVAGLLHGAAGDPVAVEFVGHADERRALELERRHLPSAVEIAFGNLPPLRYRFETEVVSTDAGRVLSLRFNVWMLPLIEAFEDALHDGLAAGAPAFDGLLFDLRGNPGGIAGTAVGIAGYLLNERVDLGSMKHRGSELAFLVHPRRVSRHGEKLEPFGGPVAVLVDGGSASTSEIFAAGLQDHGRARIFGEPTAAAALPAVIEKMPNGDLLMRAIADFTRPNGERIEGRPVVPESLVPLTREGLLAGRDEPREAALAWIASELLRGGHR